MDGKILRINFYNLKIHDHKKFSEDHNTPGCSRFFKRDIYKTGGVFLG